MPVPKKRRSKAKKRTKKACWKIETPNLRPCPACGALTLSHQVCSECGTYKGKQVISKKVKSKKES
ncbi:50S ribosomal protein L32 [Thermoproteota archaeon]